MGEIMNPELKAKWVAALRSGQYKQTCEFLRDSKGYCCLGVLAEINNPDVWCSADVSKNEDGYLFTEMFNARERLGLPHGLLGQLAQMNDTGKSFGTIADYIESRDDA